MTTVALHAPARQRATVFLVLWLACLAVSAFFSVRIQSTVTTALPEIDKILPREIPGWEFVPDGGLTIVSPQQAETLHQIYDETVNRTYRQASTGRVVMLAIAYGRDQSHRNQVHKPEVCYPAQGFRLSNVEAIQLQVAGKPLQATRLAADLGSRHELVQYWMLQGERVIRGAISQNLYRTARALRGERTDGLLFRTSVIGLDSDEGFATQQAFVDSLFAALPADQRSRFIGQLP